MSDTMTEDFASYIAGERARLESARAELVQDRRLIDERIANIDDEMRAITAYETAKLGKQPKTAAPRRARAQRGAVREGILNVIADYPNGIGRGEIIDRLGLKGDKSGETSVSNALTALTKRGDAYREGGKYFVPQDVLRAAAE